MITRAFIIREIQALKPELTEKYQVTRIGLFGSFAADSAREDSDVDILIDFKKPAGWDFFRIQMMLEQRLNRKIDLVTSAALKESMKYDILDSVIDL